MLDNDEIDVIGLAEPTGKFPITNELISHVIEKMSMPEFTMEDLNKKEYSPFSVNPLFHISISPEELNKQLTIDNIKNSFNHQDGSNAVILKDTYEEESWISLCIANQEYHDSITLENSDYELTSNVLKTDNFIEDYGFVMSYDDSKKLYSLLNEHFDLKLNLEQLNNSHKVTIKPK